MVPTFALYPLPLMPRPGVASDDLPATDGDFAAVLAALGQEVPPPDPTAALSFASGVPLVVPAIAVPQVTGAGGDSAAPEADPWTKGAWPDKTADALSADLRSAIMPALDMLAPNLPGRIMAAPSGLVLPSMPFDANTTGPKAVEQPEAKGQQIWATPPVGPAPPPVPSRDRPEAAPAAPWATQVAAVQPGISMPSSASASLATTGMDAASPQDAATPSSPKSALVGADEPSPVPPVFASPFTIAPVNPTAFAPASNQPWPIENLPKIPPIKAPTPMASSPLVPIRTAHVSDAPAGSRAPETALWADPPALASSQPLPQTTSQFQPMRESIAILTPAVFAPSQMAPSEHLPHVQTGQPPPPTQPEMAGPAESPQQTATPSPAVGLGTTAQALVLQNAELALGNARRMASGDRDAATESGALPTEPTVTALPPITAADSPRPTAVDPVALSRPTLPDSTSETRAVLRQLAPSTPDQEGAVEIALFPKGLGQVKLDIQHGPDGARIIVSAERPETLDLIRRHSADLVAEFRAAGMANPVVSFAAVDAGQPAQPPQRPDSAALLAGGGFGGSSQHTGGSSQGQSSPRQDSPLGTEQPDLTPPPYRSEVVPRGGLILRL